MSDMLMLKYRVPNTNKLSTEQVKERPLRIGDRPITSDIIGRCISADNNYIYCEVEINEALNKLLFGDKYSIELIERSDNKHGRT